MVPNQGLCDTPNPDIGREKLNPALNNATLTLWNSRLETRGAPGNGSFARFWLLVLQLRLTLLASST